MANPIQIKRSSTASAVPAAGSLLVGELAVNLADKKLYTKNGGGTVITIAQPTPGTSAQLLASDGSGGFAAVTVGSGLSLSGGTLAATAGGGGSVTSVSVVTANGISGTVANASTTPAITLSLGAIDPTSVGATTPGTGKFTTLTATGTNSFLTANGATTAGRFMTFANDGGTSYFGLDSSTGGNFGFGNYAFNLYTAGDFVISRGGGEKLRTTSTQVKITGTLFASNNLEVGGVSYFASGTVSAPSLILNSETGTGLYRIGANNHGYAVSGAKVLDIASTGLTVTGALSSTTDISDSKGEIRLLPQNSQSAAYTLVLADAGKHILHPAADTTARTFTIPANSSVAYPIGTAITFVNQNAGGTVTIAITSDTMCLAGAGTTGSRTLAANGVATALKITSTEWIVSGTGLT